ncbi:MAG TPA: dephospho-CoA kinase [Gammaproteobacteria bacterium]|nr:dephospho-CoA kinase [Gammaproteobacteria bacterium]
MLKIGLTGGIASGKSQVAAGFARLGVPIVDADLLSRQLTAPGQAGLDALVAILGRDVLDAQGRLDRAALRARVFADAGLRRRVEAVLHPLVVEGLKSGLAAAQGPYVIASVPLLVEVPSIQPLVDRILVVDCPEELQISRLMSRDRDSEAQARAILAAQATRDARLAVADDILSNAGDLAALEAAVGRLHGFYLELAVSGDFKRRGYTLP